MNERKIEISFVSDRAAEFVVSLFRIGQDEEFKKLESEYGITIDKKINNYVKEVISSLSERHKDVLERYFSNFLGVGLALLTEGQSVKEFLNDIDKLSNIEMAYYMLITWGEIEFTIDELATIVNQRNIYAWIEENFAVSDQLKWQIMKLLNCPEEVKEELLDLLHYYYDTFYIDKEVEIEKFLKEYIEENRQELIEATDSYLDYFISPESREELFASNEALEVLVSYFFDFGTACAKGTESLILGYRYPELAEILLKQGNDLLQYSKFFKVLADDTRLKVLLEINESPKYLAQLAEIMDSSNPAISYHINKLMEVGLIEIGSADNRIYYQVRKNKINEVIDVLNNVFL
ncbi:MAG: ArsR/SmtB family transcription factor [Halanaerobiales bacterium]